MHEFYSMYISSNLSHCFYVVKYLEAHRHVLKAQLFNMDIKV